MTLYFLLPQNITISLPVSVSIFMTAQFVGLVSFVPGGLGVFEAVLLLLLPAGATHPQIVGSLVSFRVIYYLFHLAIGAALLGIHELLQLGKKLKGKEKGGESILFILESRIPERGSRIGYVHRGLLPVLVYRKLRWIEQLLRQAPTG